MNINLIDSKIWNMIFKKIKEENIIGDILELGSFNGQGLIYMKYLRDKYLSNNVKIHGIDRFIGLPHEEDGWKKGQFKSVSINKVFENIKIKTNDLSNIYIHKGLFNDEKTINYISKIEKISFIYFDADTKTSTLEALFLVKDIIKKQKITYIGFDDWGCFNYTLCAAFGKFIHNMENFSFTVIGRSALTIFFKINNNET